MDFFLRLPYSFIAWFISLFPASGGFPAEVVSSAEYIGGFMSMFTPLMPLETLVVALLLVFHVEVGILFFKTAKWVMSHIPFFGGRG